ncbi:ATP-binding cassette domain-containing protein [Glycomyces tarimensis]
MSDKPDERDPPVYVPGDRDPAPEPPEGETLSYPWPEYMPPHEPSPDSTLVFERPESSGPPFLTAEAISAAGRQGPVFTGVSVTAHLGQLVAVSGDGGDGRTSLLLALTGRFALASGTLTVDGDTRPGEIRRRFAVAQAAPAIAFDEYHTVADCIKETVAVSGKAATRHNVHAWLDRLAVDVDTGDTYGFLPRIEQTRFAIACAAATRTPAIVVDDADDRLNDAGGERVFEALRTVADAGQLVIAACARHDPPAADTVVDIRGGHDPNGVQL